MSEQLMDLLQVQERALREVADRLARILLRVQSLQAGGWQGSAANAFHARAGELEHQLGEASAQLAQAVMTTVVMRRGWGSRDQ